jgi:ADP-ribosylglycohydrolase
VLAEPDPVRALALAANHDGDSDSTGAIVSNLLGAIHGRAWLPPTWLGRLELRPEIERIAVELAWVSVGQHPLWDEYPRW